MIDPVTLYRQERERRAIAIARRVQSYQPPPTYHCQTCNLPLLSADAARRTECADCQLTRERAAYDARQRVKREAARRALVRPCKRCAVGMRQPSPGQRYCARCRALAKREADRRNVQRRKSAGLCVYGGCTARPAPGGIRCEVHARKHREYGEKLRPGRSPCPPRSHTIQKTPNERDAA